MALKMSMCQFSVPLLLPNCDTKQSTLMLWAMRDIVKKYRPQSLLESKGFIEENVVSELPMISFVRLGECSLSKSEILNKLLSNSQQYHDTFVHSNMEGAVFVFFDALDSECELLTNQNHKAQIFLVGNRQSNVFSLDAVKSSNQVGLD
ncbi:hypothetical protein F7725_006235 [Dissostichus mawsoni]|uniref:Up-regulator of cell proliferation-like domain-containing protein n=1 Tax=Dissostichus mawsoni TaxID=36200 RepID=A0A7J5YTU8_DISMA|nr:hypothetical protein F7725_006235 [Dissostichus mawsoni]